jgi:glycosyltransferase involved in cell wall biosynthesis
MLMANSRPLFSVCIPAYNRARHLQALLDSIYVQDYRAFEIIICEDFSRERAQIAAIIRKYADSYPGTLRYNENEANLGYDANIRRLVEKASGEYCFFMGNDDLMCPGALSEVAGILARHQNIGLVLKSYAWFDANPEKINQEVRYFGEEREFAPGKEAVRICFRRSGVISGYIVHRDSAHAAATDKFDGSLYYQMHLTANVLVDRRAVCTPKVLVNCRKTAPEFGASASEKEKYVPGCYTPDARLRMISGALAIAMNLRETRRLDVVEDIAHDYANYFYPYIKDQLSLRFDEFLRLYNGFSRMGFRRYPMFHIYCILGYALGEKNFDRLTRMVRSVLGRSPQFGRVRLN